MNGSLRVSGEETSFWRKVWTPCQHDHSFYIRVLSTLSFFADILFVGMGVSGGEEGARNGPSLMPGCRQEAYNELSPILTKIAARANDGSPCVTHIGDVGSGNYVKMVHNGIEYADMQLIAEAYDLLSKVRFCFLLVTRQNVYDGVVGIFQVGNMSNEELSKIFASFNESELESFLIDITSKIFAKKDDQVCYCCLGHC